MIGKPILNDMTESEDRTPWGLVTVLLLAGVVTAFQVGKVPGTLPLLRSDLELSLFKASWIISIFPAIGAATGVVMGAFADRIGYRRLVLCGLSLVILGNIAGGLTPSYRVLLVSRFIEGIGFFFTVLSAPSMIARFVNPRHTRFTLGVWGAYMPSGIGLMLFISPFFVKGIGWQGLWHVNAGVCFFTLLLFVHTSRTRFKGRPPRAKGHIHVWPNIRSTLSRPGPFLLALCFTCYSGQWIALMTFLPTFFIEVLGIDETGAALLTAFAVVFNIPGNILAGWLLQRNIPRRTLLTLSFIVMALCSVGVYSHDTPQMIRLTLCFIFSFIGGIIPGSLMAGAPVHSPGKDLLGATNGLLSQGSNLGTMLAPPVLAAVVESMGGWHGVPWIFIVAGSIGLFSSFGIGRLEQ